MVQVTVAAVLSPADAPMFHVQQADRSVKISLELVGNAVILKS